MTKKKLLLINPVSQYRRGLRMRIASTYPPLPLGILAALTPDTWEVKLIDENFEEFSFEPADFVAFTSFTTSAPRVYEIATIYKQHNIKTVFGGVHATMCTEEALNYVDVVVQGEVESVWAQIIKDFENNELKRLYKGDRCEIVKHPTPRFDLFSEKYLFYGVSTTRGCPMNCDFCSVSVFSGNKHRYREIEDVIDDLEAVPSKFVLFLDDNIAGYSKKGKDRAIQLFKRMIERKIKKEWIAQVSLDIAYEPEVLYWMKKSGCRILLIGIEAEVTDSLKDVNKNLNIKIGVDYYKQAFRNIHKHGIGILGTFIFGLDTDDRQMLLNRAKYIIKSSVDTYQTTILTPLPGTPLYKRFEEQGRIEKNNYPQDWVYYHMTEPVYKPAKMTSKEIHSTMKEVWDYIYNRRSARIKFIRTLINTRSFQTALWTYGSIYNYYSLSFEDEILAKDPKYYKWLKKRTKKKK